jgi:hypothetical protein
MANEFVAKNGLISQNNTTVTGSLTVTQGITGSLSGSTTLATTASYVLQAVSASFSATSSFANAVDVSYALRLIAIGI